MDTRNISELMNEIWDNEGATLISDRAYARDPMLVEREKTHGDFGRNALISQALKAIMHRQPDQYSPVQSEAIDMICLKLSRIASGQAWHKDHWDDIAGYAKLATE